MRKGVLKGRGTVRGGVIARKEEEESMSRGDTEGGRGGYRKREHTIRGRGGEED